MKIMGRCRRVSFYLLCLCSTIIFLCLVNVLPSFAQSKTPNPPYNQLSNSYLCGNHLCETIEPLVCPQDCPSTPAPLCGDYTCQVSENHTSCPQDCSSFQCGDGFCDASQNENGVTCGADCALSCGDNFCQPTENYVTCQVDCPSPLCGNGTCEVSNNENGLNCGVDCPITCGNGTCESAENYNNCQIDCPLSKTPGKGVDGKKKKQKVSKK